MDLNGNLYTNNGKIVGGYNNVATGETKSFIGGGQDHSITSSNFSVIGGGYYNRIGVASGTTTIPALFGAEGTFFGHGTAIPHAFTASTSDTYMNILGGVANTLNAYHGSQIIGGSQGAIIGSSYSTILNGKPDFLGNNVIHTYGGHSHIGNGKAHEINYGYYNSIHNGKDNTITSSNHSLKTVITNYTYNDYVGGLSNTILNGNQNVIINSDSSTILNGGDFLDNPGANNVIGGSLGATIINGTQHNIRYSNYSFVGGGYLNRVMSGDTSVIVGGGRNTILTSERAFIGAGLNNSISGSSNYSSIIAGQNNEISGLTNTHIIGSNITGTTANTLFINNLNIQDTPSSSTTLNEILVIDTDGSVMTRDIESFLSGDTLSASTPYEFTTGSTEGAIEPSYSIDKGIWNGGVWSSILGGTGHTIDKGGDKSSIVGGADNEIRTVENAFIGGGKNNQVRGLGSINSSVVGGEGNMIGNGWATSITGGLNNKISGNTTNVFGSTGSVMSSIDGGWGNNIYNAVTSTINGGYNNYIGNNYGGGNFYGGYQQPIGSQCSSSIVGGASNIMNKTQWGFIGSGSNNKIIGEGELFGALYSNTIINGFENGITASTQSTIIGGLRNTIGQSSGGTMVHSMIGSGVDNNISNDVGQVSAYNIIGGGENNKIVGPSFYNNILNGWDNVISGNTGNSSKYNNILNGYENNIIGGGSVTIIGNGNTVTDGSINNIVGSYNNINADNWMSTINGHGNVIAGGGGYGNTIVGGYNTIPSGLTHTNIIGSSITAVSGDTTYVNKLNLYDTPTTGNTVTDILVRDTDGSVKVREVSTLSPFTTSSGNTSILPTNNLGNINNRLISTIGGGSGNTISAKVGYEQYGGDFIGGGSINNITNSHFGRNFIGGGGYWDGSTGNTITMPLGANGGGNSIVGGGLWNGTNKITYGYNNIIGGGHGNEIYGGASSIVGGGYNTINNYSYESFIGGGKNNVISGGNGIFIGAGAGNTINNGGQSSYTVIGGGKNNKFINSSYLSFIGGGEGNEIKGFGNSSGATFSAILGGQNNLIENTGNFYTGGQNAFNVHIIGSNITGTTSNTTYVNNLNLYDTPTTGNTVTDLLVRDTDGSIKVREFNTVTPFTTSVNESRILPFNSGGNSVSSEYSSILGGSNNIITGNTVYNNNTIAGGISNLITSTVSNSGGGNFIGGGGGNYNYGTVTGNIIDRGYGCVIVGGGTWEYNVISGGTPNGTSILGGDGNLIQYGSYASIVGGRSNTILSSGSNYSTILGGGHNIASATNVHIIGSNITGATANTTYVENLNIGTVVTGDTVNDFLVRDTDGTVKVRPKSTVLGYKSYVAIITQTGATIPTAVVLQQEMDAAPVWDYTSVGTYTLLSTDWDIDKTVVFIDLGENGFSPNNASWSFTNVGGSNVIDIFTTDGGGVANDLFDRSSIEIRVYE